MNVRTSPSNGTTFVVRIPVARELSLTAPRPRRRPDLAASAIRQAPETILVVDDDQDMCWVLEVALAGLGYVVKTVGTAQSAISSVADHAFSVAFVDARLPDMDGLRLVEQLRGLRPAMRIIMISGYYLEDDTRILEAMRASANRRLPCETISN